MSGATVLRLAFAIVFNALAFTVWDVGTRPPLRLFRDVARGMRVRAKLVRGLLRFVIGLGLLLLAGFVALPVMPTMQAFTVIETGMLAAALLVEQLIGADLRARRRSAKKPASG